MNSVSILDYSIRNPRFAAVFQTMVGLLAGLTALLAPTAASADEVFASAVAGEKEGSFTVSATFDVGIADVITVSQDDDGEREAADIHASPTLGVTPAVGYKFSDILELGAEVVLVWIVPEAAENRRLLASPHARARVAFPVWSKLTLDATLGAGMTFWTEADEEEDADEVNEFMASRLGWSIRMAIGGSWAFTDWFGAYGSFGYYTSQSFGDDLTTRFGTVLFSAGFRLSI